MAKDIYKTSSIQLSSYLCSLDEIEFVGANQSQRDSNKLVFIFSPADKSKMAAADYFSGRGEVAPIELFKNFRMLKDLIFETDQGEL